MSVLSNALILACLAVVGLAVIRLGASDWAGRLTPNQRSHLICAYIGGMTLIFDIGFYYLFREALGTLIFAPIGAFTMWMFCAMVTLVLKVRHDVGLVSISPQGFAIWLTLSVILGLLTIGAVAFAVFKS